MWIGSGLNTIWVIMKGKSPLEITLGGDYFLIIVSDLC